jgi:hypothetical protein
MIMPPIERMTGIAAIWIRASRPVILPVAVSTAPLMKALNVRPMEPSDVTSRQYQPPPANRPINIRLTAPAMKTENGGFAVSGKADPDCRKERGTGGEWNQDGDGVNGGRLFPDRQACRHPCGACESLRHRGQALLECALLGL